MDVVRQHGTGGLDLPRRAVEGDARASSAASVPASVSATNVARDVSLDDVQSPLVATAREPKPITPNPTPVTVVQDDLAGAVHLHATVGLHGIRD